MDYQQQAHLPPCLEVLDIVASKHVYATIVFSISKHLLSTTVYW